MGKFTGMDGRAILKAAREEILNHGAHMSVTAGFDHLPAEHRARVRAERTAAVRAAREEAYAALRAWAGAEEADAKKRLNADPVKSAAEESRRVADELRIGRLVEAARAKDTPKIDAADLAERASRAYADGRADEAEVLARASAELGGPGYASEIVENVRLDRVLADPAKARAMRDLGDVAVVVAAFERDVNAATSRAMQDAADLARAIGDGAAAAELGAEASSAGRTAKVAAALASKPFGGDGSYAEPAGVVPGLPEDRDPRGVAQPWGARLPGKDGAA